MFVRRLIAATPIASLAFACSLSWSVPAFGAPSEAAKAAHEAALKMIEAKRFDEAKVKLDEAVKSSPDYAEAWLALGNAHLATGSFVEAAAAFDRTLSLNPDQPLARYNLAYALRKSGQHARAAEAYRSYLQSAPNDADAYYGLGEALKESGDLPAAADAYDRYAELEKRPGREKWTQKARELAAELRAKSPKPAEDTRPHLSFARKDMKTWDGGAQKPSATPSTKRPPEFESGLAALKEARYADALTDLSAAEKTAPADPFVLGALAGAHLGVHEAEKAEALYRRALALNVPPAEAALRYGLAESLRHQGKDEEAARELEAVVQSAQPGLTELAKERLAALR